MGLLHVCLVLTSLFILAKPTESCSRTKEFTFYDPVNPDQETCKRCPKCPPGKGLEKQCGSKVQYGTFTGCKPCKYNETYSDKNDTSHCKPCNQCGFKIVLQQCTPWQNRRCAPICRSGYYMDHVVHECKVVPGNKTTGTPRAMAMTTAELNSATVRSFPRSNSTSRSTGTTAPTQSPEPTSPVVHNAPTSTNYTLTTEDPSARIESSPSPDQDSKPKIIAGCVVVGVVLVLIIIYIYCKTHSHSFEGDGSSEILLDNLSNGVSILNIQRIPEDLRISAMDNLRDHDGHLMLFKVQNVLDRNETASVKTWFIVGLALKATMEEMGRITQTCCQAHGSPTHNLLLFFKTKGDAEPSMRDFVNALIQCERHDVARDICNWPYELIV